MPIYVEKMRTVPDIGEVLTLKMYTETKLLFVLCKSGEELNKQKIFYTNIKDGGFGEF